MSKSEEAKDTSSDGQSKWKLVAVISLIVLILSGLWNLAQFYDWFNKPGPDLIVETQTSEFSFPEKMWDDFDEFTDSVSGEMYKSKLEFDRNYKRLQSQVVVSIGNNGDLPANDVRLVFDHSGIAEIRWDDGTTEQKDWQSA